MLREAKVARRVDCHNGTEGRTAADGQSRLNLIFRPEAETDEQTDGCEKERIGERSNINISRYWYEAF